MIKYLFIFLFSIQFGNAQVTNLDCVTAILANNGYTTHLFPNTGNGNINDLQTPNTISNPQINPIGTNAGCMLANESDPQWFIFKICNSGNFELLMGSDLGSYPQMGFSDWSIWKYTASTCSKIFNNQLGPLRCNWNSSIIGGTGICDTLNLPPNGVKYNYEPPLHVNAGDSLILCFSNYSGLNYFVDFLSTGTASINCSVITSLPKTTLLAQKAVLYNTSTNKIDVLDKDIKIITIHDVQGKEIYKNKMSGVDFIDCSNFNKGLYFLTYYSGNETGATEKIIIQ
ncbi:MAG: T9SS type A sorting domain-containing protein [Bacteroidia bacterium]